MTALQGNETLTPDFSGTWLGTMTFGDTVDEATANAMLSLAESAGVRQIDTANGYAGGISEEILGRALQTRRESVVLATKAGVPHPDAEGAAPLSGAGIRKCFEGSLRRLRTDYVDLFYLHMPDRSTEPRETIEVIAELYAEGKIKALGVSNYASWQVAELVALAVECGAPTPIAGQYLYNMLGRRLEEEYLEYAAQQDLQTIVYNPLAGGLLTGRYVFGQHPGSGRFGDSLAAAMYTDRYWDRDLFAAVDQLATVAQDAGISLVELALRWVRDQAGVQGVLIGGTKIEQFEANIAALAGEPLPAEVIAACDRVGTSLRGPMPAYNR